MEKNNKLFLGVSGINSENADNAPYTELPGDNTRQMSSFYFTILFNNDNSFKGVRTPNGKEYSLADWNKQFIDLNPKRARMVPHPQDYSWSSFHYYAYGKENPLLTPAPSYLKLALTPQERQKVYLAMVEEILKNDWKEKRPYSSVPFIGNPDWVQKKTAQLQFLMTQKTEEWKKRYQQKFVLMNSS